MGEESSEDESFGSCFNQNRALFCFLPSPVCFLNKEAGVQQRQKRRFQAVAFAEETESKLAHDSR